MHIAVLVPNQVPTAQDFVGPWEVLSRWPGRSSLQLVTSRPGMVRCDSGMEVHIPTGLDDLPDPDVVVVPGGSDPYAAADDAEAVDWLKRVAPGVKWFGTVCTGAAVLARAGLLEGRVATTHWVFRDELRAMGVEVSDERVVVSGNVITGAGVTAGIDMALTMTLLEHGQDIAEAIQLSMEYDPAPPTNSGSPTKARPEVTTFVRDVLTRSVLSKNPARKAAS